MWTDKEARRLEASKLHFYEGGQGVEEVGIRDLSLPRDGSFLACGRLINASNPLGAVSNSAVLVLNWKTGAMKTLQHPKEDINGVAWGVRFHRDVFIIAASGGISGGFLWFTESDQESEFFKFALPNTSRDLDLHTDGIQIATAHTDGIIRIRAILRGPDCWERSCSDRGCGRILLATSATRRYAWEFNALISCIAHILTPNPITSKSAGTKRLP